MIIRVFMHNGLISNKIALQRCILLDAFAGKAWSACWQGLLSAVARRGQQAGKGYSANPLEVCNK